MNDTALTLVQSLQNETQLARFAANLRNWLLVDPDRPEHAVDFGDSRARALLRTTDAADDATLNDFSRLVATPAHARLALYDLLHETGLAEREEVQALAAISSPTAAESPVQPIAWLSLVMAAYAHQREYPVLQLDPALPPGRYSPAGHIVFHTAHFLRQQIQRSATERERMAQAVAYRPQAGTAGQPGAAEERIAPLPPHFRPPIPVRYPEVARETLHIDPDEQPPPPATGTPLVITEDDLSQEQGQPRAQAQTPANQPDTEQPPAGQPPESNTPPVRMPEIRITRDQVAPQAPPSPLPASGVIMPASSTDTRPGLSMAIRQVFRSEEMKTTKLRVHVQDRPDGEGLYGLQVRITCKGIRSYVAGTTDRNGTFVAELPVRAAEGLTYDVEVSWPREMGGDTERKSITLHADRTEFTLPFHRTLGTNG